MEPGMKEAGLEMRWIKKNEDEAVRKMKNSAEIILEVPQAEAGNIIAALKKESAANGRFEARIAMRGKKLGIIIEAEDIVALRSVLNSYLRYLQTIEGLKENDL